MGPAISKKESIDKLKTSTLKYKKIFYVNEKLKCSTCFCKDEIEIIPSSWSLGRKYGGYNKMKTYIIPLMQNVHFKLVCNNIFIDEVFYHINLLNKKELSLGMITYIEHILADAINNIDINNENLIYDIYMHIIHNIDNIKILNTNIYKK